ncbi:hypothetical protein [Streptomyces sp. Wb2n-11]|uniref:hypothetical protein n=1 Tax=Streptomyces sp. Wb2n-11 TaxID=1030533 RepID=UPI000ACC2909|nr:hypothetical protein [Streptomyces sp. Wb2n-11]
MTNALPAELVAYLERQDDRRANTLAAKLASYTDWERALIKDAAVMGYVRGKTHPKGEPHPKDSHVLAEVVGECMAFPDLYPAISTETQPTEDEQHRLAFERAQYAAAIRQLIRQVKQTAHAWLVNLPDTIRTADVAQALGTLCSPKPLPEDLRDDLWQRIVGAYYLRFENDGHPEDSQAAADEAMAIVQPELDRLRTKLDQVTALHQPVQHLGQTWCSACSVRRSTGPRDEEWVAFIPHPCPTLDAISDPEAKAAPAERS